MYLWELHSIFSTCAQDRAAGGPCRSSQGLNRLFLRRPGLVIRHLVLSSRFKPRYRVWASGPSQVASLPSGSLCSVKKRNAGWRAVLSLFYLAMIPHGLGWSVGLKHCLSTNRQLLTPNGTRRPGNTHHPPTGGHWRWRTTCRLVGQEAGGKWPKSTSPTPAQQPILHWSPHILVLWLPTWLKGQPLAMPGTGHPSFSSDQMGTIEIKNSVGGV